mgnify:FL=1
MERHGPVGSEPIRVEEIVRRDLETRTLAVVDALYDLAARAADGQPSSVLGVGESVYVMPTYPRNHVVRRLADIDAMRGHIHARIPKDVLEYVGSPDAASSTRDATPTAIRARS